jgi:hypothetical protein
MWSTLPNRLAQAVTPLSCVRELPCSNLFRDIYYPGWVLFSVGFLGPSWHISDNYLKSGHSHFLPYICPVNNDSLIIIPSITVSTRTLGSWVRILLEAWMCVCFYSVCAVLCVDSGLARGWSPVQGVLPTVYAVGLRNWKSGQGPIKGCRAIDEWMNEWMNEWMIIVLFDATYTYS